MEDEQIIAEETATSPSEEEQTTTVVEETPAVVEEVKGKAIPYNRFKEVVDERNKYKELLETVKPDIPATVIKPTVEDMSYQTEDINQLVKPIIDQTVDRKISQINRQLELDRTIAKNPDFFQYADPIKTKIQENPNLTWEDAYKLSKYDSSISQAREIGRQEAVQSIQEKKKATVESAIKTKQGSAGGSGEINPLSKGPDGKFLYSTKELADILPKSN